MANEYLNKDGLKNLVDNIKSNFTSKLKSDSNIDTAQIGVGVTDGSGVISVVDTDSGFQIKGAPQTSEDVSIVDLQVRATTGKSGFGEWKTLTTDEDFTKEIDLQSYAVGDTVEMDILTLLWEYYNGKTHSLRFIVGDPVYKAIDDKTPLVNFAGPSSDEVFHLGVFQIYIKIDNISYCYIRISNQIIEEVSVSDVLNAYVWDVSTLPIADGAEIQASLLKSVISNYLQGKPVFVYDGANTLPTSITHNSEYWFIESYTIESDLSVYSFGHISFPYNILDLTDDEYVEVAVGGTPKKLVQNYELESAIANKADKATTLRDYGITDWLFKFLGYSENIDDTSGWGVFHHNSSAVGLPSTYGSVLQWSNRDYDTRPSLGGWYVQLFSSTNPNNSLYHRQRVNGGDWTEWNEILDERNYKDYTYPKSTIDSKLSSIDSTSIINGTNNVWGSIDPTTLPLVAYERGNKLFGLKGDEVIVEYSTDGGATWVEYAVTDNDKFNLFNDKGQWLRLGGSDDTISDDCMFRVTVNLIYYRYCTLNKILIYSSTFGASEFYCTLDRYNYDGNWYNVFTDKKLLGWSGNNVINFNSIYFYNAPVANYQNNKLRFTFRQVVGSSQTVNARVMRIQGFGTTTFEAANNMMKYNRLYDVDINMNAIFENGIYPYKNLTSDLGTSSNKWNNIYTNKVNDIVLTATGTGTKYLTDDGDYKEINLDNYAKSDDLSTFETVVKRGATWSEAGIESYDNDVNYLSGAGCSVVEELVNLDNEISTAINNKADKTKVVVVNCGGETACNLGVVSMDGIVKIENGGGDYYGISELTIRGFAGHGSQVNTGHHEVLIEWDCGADDMTLVMPDTTQFHWANDETPTFKAGWHYQLSVTYWAGTVSVRDHYLAVCVGFPLK